MKSKLVALATSTVISAASMVPVAMASTVYQHKMNKTEIRLNNALYESMVTFTAPDAGVETTYMPIWYVQQAINKIFGIGESQDTWDGKNWRLSIGAVSTTSIARGYGNTTIYVNGMAIENTPSIVGIDPASGVETTFVPIWYVQQLLNRLLGLSTSQDTWNGNVSPKRWDLTNIPPVPNGDQGSSNGQGVSTSQVVSAFAQALGVSIGALKAPSTPNMTIGQVDQMYWNYIGIPVADAQYQPGGDPLDWGLYIGLNQAIAGNPMSASDVNQMKTNLSQLKNGYWKDYMGDYHVAFQPEDEWPNTFKGGVLPPNLQASIIKAYQEMNGIAIKMSGNELIVSATSFPAKSDWDLNVSGGTDGTVQYSLNGGNAWHTASQGYDSWEGPYSVSSMPTGFETVMFKATNRIDLQFTQFWPKGNIELSEVMISTDGHGGITVQRLSANQ